MATYNKITLLGNVAAEPRTSVNGNATDIYLAVNSTRKDEDPLFINVRTFDKNAQFVQNYVTKGSCILVDGKLNLYTFTDKSGKEQKRHYVTAYTLQLVGGGKREEQRGQDSFQSKESDEDISF